MRKFILGLGALMLAGPLLAEQLDFDFSAMPTNQAPADFVSLVGGEGKPGVWRVIQDQVPVLFAPATPQAPTTAPKNVVAQMAWDATDEHFPMLQLSTNTFGDFTFTTRFKIVDGFAEQMAGIAFRMQDTRNYYYIRASALSDTFYFYRVLKGERSPAIGNQIKIGKGVWHDLSIACAGPNIDIALDHKPIPTLNDPTFAAGKIAYWTKSDSIAYFTDTHIKYKPREIFAQVLVHNVMAENPHLLGLQVLIMPADGGKSKVIASNETKDIGQPGETTDADCIARGVNYYRTEGHAVYVTMPLRDRNGDPLGAIRIIMKKGPFQSQENALTRATPILAEMQKRAATVDRLY